MAQKYVVKNEDNPLTLAKKFETSPQAILQNNAIKSLTAGQTIKIPSTGFQTPTTNGFTTASKTPNGNSGGGQYSTAQTENNYVYKQPTGSFISNAGNTAITYNPTPVYGYSTAQTENPFVYKFPTSSFLSNNGNTALTYNSQNAPAPSFFLNSQQQQQVRAQGSFVSGGGQVNLAQVPRNGNIPQNITNGGYLSQNGAYVSTQQQTNTHAQVPIFGQVTTTQLQQQIAQQNAQTPQTPQIPARPQGVFTGDPKDPNTAQWRNYWNWQARNPSLVPQAAPVVMTRDQVWNMKAEQRRRENRGSDTDGQVSYQPYLQPVQPVYEPFMGNNVTQGSFRG